MTFVTCVGAVLSILLTVTKASSRRPSVSVTATVNVVFSVAVISFVSVIFVPASTVSIFDSVPST